MSIRTMILGLAAVASVAVPGVASAQSWGHQYRDGYYGRYYGNDRWDDRRDRHRWEQRRRWIERERRREWRRAQRDHHGYYGQRYNRY